MGIEVTRQNTRGPVLLSSRMCTIGKTYRRQSQPNKLYLCARSYDGAGHETNVGMMISLSHGNRVRNNLDVLDFIEVDIKATVVDSVL